MQTPGLDIKEIEKRSLNEAINTKKEIFKDDINAFLNSLSEEEFAIYMKQAQTKDDLWDTGREKTLNVALKGEDKTEIKEKQMLEESRQEEILREKLEVIEWAQKEDLRIFKPILFQDFIQIFDIECFEKLPLFVKLFYLKELMQYNQLYENRAFSTMTILMAASNYWYYYFMKYIYISNKVKLISPVRFIWLFFGFNMAHSGVFMRSQYLNSHYVDLNPLLDTDDLFLYEDEYYRALIRRVITLYPQILNDNYDFKDILDEKSEIFDKHFGKRGMKQYNQSEVMKVFSHCLGTNQDAPKFSTNFNAFEKMMKKYGSFFEKQKEEFIKETEEHFATQVNQEIVTSLVEYYDLLKENKLEEIQEVHPILNAPEHEYMKMVEKCVQILDESYDGIEINNKMTLEQRIEVLRKFDHFERKLKEKEMPKVEDLMDVTIGEKEIAQFEDKSRFLPQKTMSYKEYLNIEKNFKGGEFERTSFLGLSLPSAMALTYLFKRIFRKL